MKRSEFVSQLRLFQVIFIVLFFGLLPLGLIKASPIIMLLGIISLALAWVMRIARFVVKD